MTVSWLAKRLAMMVLFDQEKDVGKTLKGCMMDGIAIMINLKFQLLYAIQSVEIKLLFYLKNGAMTMTLMTESDVSRTVQDISLAGIVQNDSGTGRLDALKFVMMGSFLGQRLAMII